MKYLILLLLICSHALMVSAQRNCGTNFYWQEELSRDPAMKLRHNQIEAVTQLKSKISKRKFDAAGAIQPVIVIPVVIHVLYNTSEQNITDAQIQSQLAVLNKDFRKQNEDTIRIPVAFASLAADCEIQFVLAKSDPQGRRTNGIIRKKTPQIFWQQDDNMKFSSSGGSDAWDSNSYLNIWVCNLSRNLLGYSTFPGAAHEKDGVVIRSDVFGTIGKSGTPYDKGRTTTHEIGHWLNLKHLWGDIECGDDGVDDTPPQKTFNSGCPSFPHLTANSCNPLASGDMFMNFMDFSNDACLQMFTAGQKKRMLSLFDDNGARNSLLYSPGLKAPVNSGYLSESSNEIPSQFTVFPNPANSTLQIALNNPMLQHQYTYTIYDLVGKIVLRGKNSGTTISIETLPTGMYYMRLQGAEKHLMTKFIKK